MVVENLTKGTTTTVPAGNSLYLTDVSTSVEAINSNTTGISVFPNPIIDNSTISFLAKSTGYATIKVFSLEGKSLISAKNEFGVGSNSFQLSLPKGTYLIQIAANDYTYTTKAISKSNSKISISFAENENTIKSKPQKIKSELTTMLYSDGDQLLYRGKSGNYTAIVTDRPTTSKTTNFDFVECKDADGNYYATVKIGSQIWMAENLKTTKYQNGESISNINIKSDWANSTSGSWCSIPINDTKYGYWYNWYAVGDSRNLAPQGWSVPSTTDWSVLTNQLGGDDLAGRELKISGYDHWGYSIYTGSNSTGFSALPSGKFNYLDFSINGVGVAGFWWSISEDGGNKAWGKYIHYYFDFANTASYSKIEGYAVRCVLDNVMTVTPFDIKQTSATSGGNITYDGNLPIKERGVCWNTSKNPTISNNKTIDGTGKGAFSSNLTGLSPNTTYYLRAYFTNSSGTFYGEQLTFKTATLEIGQLYRIPSAIPILPV